MMVDVVMDQPQDSDISLFRRLQGELIFRIARRLASCRTEAHCPEAHPSLPPHTPSPPSHPSLPPSHPSLPLTSLSPPLHTPLSPPHTPLSPLTPLSPPSHPLSPPHIPLSSPSHPSLPPAPPSLHPSTAIHCAPTIRQHHQMTTLPSRSWSLCDAVASRNISREASPLGYLVLAAGTSFDGAEALTAELDSQDVKSEAPHHPPLDDASPGLFFSSSEAFQHDTLYPNARAQGASEAFQHDTLYPNARVPGGQRGLPQRGLPA